MAIFKGAGVAIVTPFYDNYEVNYKKLEELINMQIAAGTDAIIICGTTGESATLTMQEHKEVIRHCVRYVNGRVPVIAELVPIVPRPRSSCLRTQRRTARMPF